jgi:hypothetical protein
MKTTHSRYAINTTHTHRWRVVKLFFLMCMCLGFTRLAYAQQIGIDAPNSISTNQFASVSLTTDCTVQGVTWQLDGGTIINSYNNNTVIEVKWTTAGYKYISASLIQLCNGQAQTAATQPTAIQVTQAPIPPITISGTVINNCGEGVSGVAINLTGSGGFTNYSTITDQDGYYSITVPYGFTGTGTASKTNHTFSFSQQVSNTSTDVTLNFSVVAQAGLFISISNCSNGQYSIGGLTPGFKYIITYENDNGLGNGSTEIEAHSTTQGFDFHRSCYNKICVQLKCGSQVPVCRTF